MPDLEIIGISPGDLRTISESDASEYVAELAEALSIHYKKEAVRRGLWKDYPALDQIRHISLKADRVKQILQYQPDDVTPGEQVLSEAAESMLEELHDIINYATFAARQIRRGQYS